MSAREELDWRDLWRFQSALHPRYAINGLDYVRWTQYALAWPALTPRPGLRLLDAGAGSLGIFDAYLTDRLKCEVCALDLPPVADALRRWVARHGEPRDTFTAVGGDIRRLPFSTGTYDAATAFNTLGHLRNDGDTVALLELLRVVKPGGRVVVTVHYNRELRAEIFRDDAQGADGIVEPGLQFWVRIYNDTDLRRRLLEPAGGATAEVRYYGETSFSWGRLYYARRPPVLRLVSRCLRWAAPLLSSWYLREVPPEHLGRDDWMGCGAVIAFTKGP
ncbi:MAG: hypothetical protein COY42_16815 [Armatimonadetes bacterium CG_4_10_14_0_8_um_filter_66_14]|nr:MAG: hypothetical protein COS65_14830 [Armatimonadetes bacterium CG06_land_8_20_14_3_00_66_21]PIX40841.1 MAG: hypothetical protein COZ57_24925 [Armatimonadetes bacterium CG_4_8_14_3_um_filter_66_20]PIZ42894.1 MAG: hypothetical protein COY42_16815 [Armatimonadetes bacterium CG_4_10_14_0_8_um_filter_66_14]PJB61882.1 MAG: hypothetical protein CO096_27135 [Armatimonadetes bacterium CG_4_9_14_3_um_filter_66_14]